MSIRNGESSRSSLPPYSRRLRLIVREEDKDDNLFVRMSLTAAFDLQSLARRTTNRDDDPFVTNPIVSEDAWSIDPHIDGDANDSVSFFPLSISIGDDVTIYASFNGGAYESSSQQDSIELPRSMLSGIANDVPEFVSVHALSSVEYGTRVLVEPSTVEDWELLEIYGDFMECGGLLSQVSVIYSNQSLTVRVGGGMDRVQIRVMEVTTSASPPSPGNELPSIWPHISSDSSISSNCPDDGEDSSKLDCVLLIQNTEVIVAPKTRPIKKPIPWSSPLRLIPSDTDWDASFEKLSNLTERENFHVEPGYVLVHSDQWPFDREWAQIKTNDSTSNQMRVVRVTTSRGIPRNNAVLYIGTRLDLCMSIFLDCVCLRPLSSTPERSLESIVLEEIHFEDDGETSLPTWNVPDIDLADSSCERSRKSCQYQIDQFALPLGVVIPLPSAHEGNEETHLSNRWCRVTSEGVDDYADGSIIELNVNDVLNLRRKLSRRCRGFSNTLLDKPTDLSRTIQRPSEIIMSSDWTKKIIDRMKHFSSNFVILHGMSGSGKTHNALLLSTLISFCFHRPIFYLDCKKLQKAKPRMSEILEEIDALFTRARDTRNAALVLDDLDSLSPNLVGDGEGDVSARTHSVNPVAIDQSKLIADRLSHLFEAAELEGIDRGNTSHHLSLIATCSSADSINPSILNRSRAPRSNTKIPVLSTEDRADLLKVMMHRHHPGSRVDFDRSDISRRTEGFLPRDFEKLSLRVIRSCQTNSPYTSIQDSLVAELAEFTPLAQISTSKGEGNIHRSWADVGGLFDVKEKLEATIRHPVIYQRIYARSQIQLPRGILLYGPSGCGKSYLVPALAQECNYPIVTCKGPEILDKYIGASEAKVRELFERAAQMAPSILFLDELEALAPRRGSDSTGVTDRVVNQLLTFLDGVEDVSSGTVFIIGATSRPDKVDPAIIRPGRLEKHLYVGPPESTDEWSDLLLKISKHWNLKPDSLLASSAGEEIAKMANDIPRLCPADVRAAFDTAHLNAVHRTLAGDVPVNDIEKVEIEMEDIKFGFRETRPSLSESEARILEPLYNSFRGHRPDFNAGSKTDVYKQKTSLR